jgi:four helix bundle protein
MDFISPGAKRTISPRQSRDFTIVPWSFEWYNIIGVIEMTDSKLSELTMDFAVKVLKVCDQVKGHYSLVNQLERAATSIGANLREANYAHSRADFISKLQIALKECYETEYWLELFNKAEVISSDMASPLLDDCGAIRRMLIASVNTAKSRIQKQ